MQYHTLKALKKYCNEEIYLTITSCFPIYLTVEPIFEDHLLTSAKSSLIERVLGNATLSQGLFAVF